MSKTSDCRSWLLLLIWEYSTVREVGFLLHVSATVPSARAYISIRRFILDSVSAIHRPLYFGSRPAETQCHTRGRCSTAAAVKLRSNRSNGRFRSRSTTIRDRCSCVSFFLRFIWNASMFFVLSILTREREHGHSVQSDYRLAKQAKKGSE